MSVEAQMASHVLEWCLPVIHDCLCEFYHGVHQNLAPETQSFAPETQSRPDLLTARHFELWIALARDDFDHLPSDRRQLADQARALCVDFQTCRAADRYVAAEIFDMIQRRFRSMKREAHAHNSALLALLRRLQQVETFEAAPAAEAKPATFARAA
jgi:hypothetical protein